MEVWTDWWCRLEVIVKEKFGSIGPMFDSSGSNSRSALY